MRRILCIAVFALVLGSVVPADAQYRRGYYHGGGGGWAAPLVGGLLIGGVVGALANQPRYYAPPVVVEQYPPRQICRREVVGRDYYGNLVIENVCRYE